MNKTPLDSNSDIPCYIASPTKLTLPVILLPQLQRVLYSQPHSLNIHRRYPQFTLCQKQGMCIYCDIIIRH